MVLAVIARGELFTLPRGVVCVESRPYVCQTCKVYGKGERDEPVLEKAVEVSGLLRPLRYQ